MRFLKWLNILTHPESLDVKQIFSLSPKRQKKLQIPTWSNWTQINVFQSKLKRYLNGIYYLLCSSRKIIAKHKAILSFNKINKLISMYLIYWWGLWDKIFNEGLSTPMFLGIMLKNEPAFSRNDIAICNVSGYSAKDKRLFNANLNGLIWFIFYYIFTRPWEVKMPPYLCF